MPARRKDIDSQTVADSLEILQGSPSRSSRQKTAAAEAVIDHQDISDDDDDAPEAVQASSAKSSERERLAKLQSLQSASKQAKRKRDAALKSQKQQAAADRKGKGRAAVEDVDVEDVEADNQVEVEEDSAPSVALEVTQSNPKSKHHRVFDDNDDEATSSTAPRLDPALFQQAELAFTQAKHRARLEEQEQMNEQARLAEAAMEAEGSSHRRGSKRSRSEGKATRVIGDTTIQQLAPESQNGQANIDSTTALTPKHNEKFLNDRLFKRKRARLTPKTGDKGKTKEADKLFLIFDPLLDKPKKEKAAKPLTRSEMEERMRFRKSAQTTFSKSQKRSMGPSIAFGAASTGKSGRGLQKGSAI